jgi:hypothetical protein
MLDGSRCSIGLLGCDDRMMTSEPYDITASPVMKRSFIAMNDHICDDARRSRVLSQVVDLLPGSKGSPEVEKHRRLASADWLFRFAAPTILRQTSLAHLAGDLASLPEIVDAETFRVASAVISRVREECWNARWRAMDILRSTAADVAAADAAASATAVAAAAAVSVTVTVTDAAAAFAAAAAAAAADADVDAAAADVAVTAAAAAADADAVAAAAAAAAAVDTAAAAAAAAAALVVYAYSATYFEEATQAEELPRIGLAAKQARENGGDYDICYQAASRVADEVFATCPPTELLDKFASVRDELDDGWVGLQRRLAAMR